LACRKFKIKRIALGGGVSANTKLRSDFLEICKLEKIELFIPNTILCTDNAAMIASAGYFKLKHYGLTPVESTTSLRCVNPPKRRKSYSSYGLTPIEFREGGLKKEVYKEKIIPSANLELKNWRN